MWRHLICFTHFMSRCRPLKWWMLQGDPPKMPPTKMLITSTCFQWVTSYLMHINFSVYMIIPQRLQYLYGSNSPTFMISKMCSTWSPWRCRHTCIVFDDEVYFPQRMFLWWSSWTLHSLAYQMRVTIGDFVVVVVFVRLITPPPPLFVDCIVDSESFFSYIKTYAKSSFPVKTARRNYLSIVSTCCCIGPKRKQLLYFMAAQWALYFASFKT